MPDVSERGRTISRLFQQGQWAWRRHQNTVQVSAGEEKMWQLMQQGQHCAEQPAHTSLAGQPASPPLAEHPFCSKHPSQKQTPGKHISILCSAPCTPVRTDTLWLCFFLWAVNGNVITNLIAQHRENQQGFRQRDMGQHPKHLLQVTTAKLWQSNNSTGPDENWATAASELG